MSCTGEEHAFVSLTADIRWRVFFKTRVSVNSDDARETSRRRARHVGPGRTIVAVSTTVVGVRSAAARTSRHRTRRRKKKRAGSGGGLSASSAVKPL